MLNYSYIMTLKLLIYFIFTTVLVVKCQDNVPDIYYSCAFDGLLVSATFPKPFQGTIFAKGYYAVPKCSTPNMASSVTQEVQLNLPLLKCGTKVRRRNRSLVENTIVIQYHPILLTVFDYSINITCRLKERLPNMFWDLYKHREPKPNTKYHSWVEFKSGNKVFGEIESQLLGVSQTLFLMVYVKDGGKNKHITVDKCIVHSDRVVNEETLVEDLTVAERCPADSLSEFSLIANSSVSDLLVFAKVNPVAVSDGSYITCALEMCKEVCPQPCKYGVEVSRWSTVSTHKIEKRSLSELEESETRKRSSLQAMTNRLKKLRIRQIARRREKELRKSTEAESSIDTTNTLEEIVITESYLPKLNRQGRVFDLKLDMPFESPELANLTEDTSKVTLEFANTTICSDIDCMPSVQNGTVEKNLQSISQTNALQNTTPVSSNTTICSDTHCVLSAVNGSVEEDINSISQTNASQNSVSSEELLSNTSMKANISIDNFYSFEKTFLNGTKQYSNVTSNCVPNLKFVSVTASLSVLTVCFFFICLGLILHLRKERKKHVLDSYLLYNFF